ncbi:MAG: sigma-70 family RNA polymerase sigma factor, partial [Candidatus Dadabacteria bacterium]
MRVLGCKGRPYIFLSYLNRPVNYIIESGGVIMKSAKSVHEGMLTILSLENKAGWLLGQNVSDLSDEDLVSLFVARRDEEAFNEIVNRYGDKVYRLAYRITGSQSDAEEVLQEVFLILVEKLSTFRKESRFSTWLYRVASNASFMFIRNSRKSSDKELSLDEYKPYNDYG